MTRFYERGNMDEVRGEYRVVVRTPDGKRVEIDLPRRVFEEIEELQREFWRTERREARHSLSLASMDEAAFSESNPEKDPERVLVERLESAPSVPADTGRAAQAIPAEVSGRDADGEDSRDRRML